MPTVEDFEAAGLYDPAVDSRTGRLDLLEWLDAQGFTITDMQRAHDAVSVGLVSLATDRRLLGGEILTRREAIDLARLSAEDFDELVTAIGLLPIPGAPDGEIGFTAEDATMLAASSVFALLLSRDEAMAIVRVIGSSVARIGEALVSMFLQNIESPHVKSGGSELVHAQQSYEAVGMLDTDFGVQLSRMLQRHTMQAVDRTRRAGPGSEERFDFPFAIGFVDLVGFTATSATMSHQELGQFLGDFEGRAHDVATAAGARVVKLIGDEVMFVSTDADAACRAASGLMSGFDFAGGHVLPRGALAYGNVLLRGGDYFGSVVNLASRLVDEAMPQELLVSDDLAKAATRCEFAPAGRRMVKGFPDPIPVNSFVSG
jgi:class 3 adenylate cyclase